MKITSLAPWFGGNRMLASHVGRELEGCSWVGIPFAGGMSELPHIGARTILVSDLHRHIINLARVARDDQLRGQLVRGVRAVLFHPDELASAQEYCRTHEPGDLPDLACATNYFVCCWMARSSTAGLGASHKCAGEFSGNRPAIRWNAGGGDSAVRYQSAIRALAEFRRVLRRCTFETMDAFDFLARCEDAAGHGIYCDPPFPGVGRRYKHNAGKTDAEEQAWHTRLRDAVERFAATRIVCRFYDHPMVRALYLESRWMWRLLEGRTQANKEASELLLVRNPTIERQLF